MLANEFRDTPLSAGRQGIKINSVTPGYTATDLNHFQGTQTVEEGVKAIIKYATMDNDIPSGKFLKDEGEIDW